MRFGLNLLLWTDTLHDQVLPILDEIKQIGYDAVEIPIFELDVDKYAQWGKRLDNAGLARTGVTIRGGGDNPISADPAICRQGVENNKRALDCAQAAGCEAMVGPFHSAIGEFSGAGPTADEWKRGIESMREVAEHAAQAGVMLGLESLNRFECYFLNTAADGARFCRDVNHPNCKMMYDTFHSHIEEKSTVEAIRSLKDCLAHVHISENDRSTPGQGNVRWPETFDTLKEIGYDNLMVVEAFGLALDKIVAATKIWRRMYQSEHQLASDALKFMKAEVAKRWR
ncbi:MAG: sugar phosphate isomerase/epimerase family protein [Thermoguttaceae bacterium]|jgi:D-psicose/D-tagatose/L-ribulose 3-epimerase